MNEDIVMFLLSLAALLCAAMIAAYWFDMKIKEMELEIYNHKKKGGGA